jgi:Cu+-exporting ATPase
VSAQTIRFPITGMTCTSCVVRITRAIRKLDGVTRVEVDLRRETATVVREPASVSDAALAAAVGEAGYQADMQAATTLPTVERPALLGRLLRRTS